MPRVGFEPTIAAGERPKTYALDRVATGTGSCMFNLWKCHDAFLLNLVMGKQVTYKGLSVSYAS